jgi:hypothetical protein
VEEARQYSAVIHILGYVGPAAIMVAGLTELYFGIARGRVFYTQLAVIYLSPIRLSWASRYEQPIRFWLVMLMGLVLALFGGSILTIVILKPSCWTYPGAIWLCPLRS